MHSQKDDDDRDADDAVLLLVFRPLNSTGQLRQSRRQTTLWRPPLQLQQDCQTRRQQQRRPQSPHQAQIVAAHRPGKCFVFSLFLSLSIICILSTAEKTLVCCICTHVMSSIRYIGYASIERKRELTRISFGNATTSSVFVSLSSLSWHLSSWLPCVIESYESLSNGCNNIFCRHTFIFGK